MQSGLRPEKLPIIESCQVYTNSSLASFALYIQFFWFCHAAFCNTLMRLHKNIFEQKGFYRLEYIDYPKKKQKEQQENKQTTNKHKNWENGA